MDWVRSYYTKNLKKKKKKKLIPPSKHKITYSPESITISFVLGENLFNSPQTENPAPEVRGGVLILPESFSAFRRKTDNEFVSLCNAPGVGFEPTTNSLTASCATAALPGNN